MRKSGFLAKKVGMSALFMDGKRVPVTLFSFEGCRVVGVQEEEDRTCVRVGIGSLKKPNKPLSGIYKGQESVPARAVQFAFQKGSAFSVGEGVKPSYFRVGGKVDVSGTTKGCGFAGGMKRWNFGGLRASHGVSISHRSIGSTGQCQDPGKVFKGKKMPGQMGGVRRTIQSLSVVMVDDEKQLLAVKGSVPGKPNTIVEIAEAIKVKKQDV